MNAIRGVKTVGDVCAAMERIAPLALAQNWDNVGLIAGDVTAQARRILLAIDLTAAVVQEAIKKQADVIVAYHPPIFKAITSLRSPGSQMESLVFRCIRGGIAIYSPHTALDAAEGGTNDVLLGLCGVTKPEPLEFVSDPRTSEYKVVVFVPQSHLEAVSTALFNAGAGHIGDYSRCSFRLPGQGTFLGGESTNPVVGRRGKLETVEEVRLEVVVPTKSLPNVVAALRSAHPYEEPAFDLYPLIGKPVPGVGRCGRLSRPTTLSRLARNLNAATRAQGLQTIGDPGRRVTDVVAVAGAAGSLPFRISLTRSHVIVTGEIRHHDALTIGRIGCVAIALGHWASERPVLASVAKKLSGMLGVRTRISAADAPPIRCL